ncbi:MAG: DUF4402 domain-containing protein [Gemmatimonadales bacterium]
MRTVLRMSAGLLGLALMATTVQAQTNNATITATAVVQSPINVTGFAPLDFGNVFPGVNKTVAVTDATAGRFDVTGANSAPVFMTFALPTDLASGGNLLPIGTWTGNWNTTASPTGTGFTPSAGTTGATLSGTGLLFVYVGATVSPAVAQPAGTYNGSVQLTVTY